MGYLRRIADYLDPVEERREVSWDALRGGIDTGGAIVNPRVAENLSTVMACVGAISSAMASLPAYVYRNDAAGRTLDETHAVARLIAKGPNEHQSWPDFMEFVIASVLLRGNALVEVQADRSGTVTALRPIPWEFVSVQMLTSGRLVFDVTEITTAYGGTGKPRRLLQSEVMHLKDRSDDGLIGRSRLQRAAAVVKAGMSMQEFAQGLYSNGMNPSAVFEMDNVLKPETREALANKLRDSYAGSRNAAKALLLDAGLHYKQISITPEDAEFLDSRRFSVEEIARLFQVPGPVVNDLTHGTFTNSETVLRWFAQATLSYWIRKFEAEFQRSVFGQSNRRLEIDLSGLLRGAPAERWQAWKIAVEAGVLTPAEVRAEEGFNVSRS